MYITTFRNSHCRLIVPCTLHLIGGEGASRAGRAAPVPQSGTVRLRKPYRRLGAPPVWLAQAAELLRNSAALRARRCAVSPPIYGGSTVP